MQAMWMAMVTLVLAFCGVLGLALASHVASWTKRRGSYRPRVNRTGGEWLLRPADVGSRDLGPPSPGSPAPDRRDR